MPVVGDTRQEFSVKSSMGLRFLFVVRPLRVFVLIGSLLAIGCDLGADPAGQKPSSQDQRVTLSTDSSPNDSTGEDGTSPTASHLPDFSRDLWQSELVSQSVAAQLRRIGKILANQERLPVEQLSSIASADFACDPLRPPRLVEVYAGRKISVLRIDPKEALEESERVAGYDRPTGLCEALLTMMRVPSSLADVRSDFRIVSFEPAEKSFTTKVLVETNGRSQQGRVEQNALWLCRWTLGKEKQLPKLLRIEVQDYEQVIVRGSGKTMFEDCTRAALSDNQSFLEQLTLSQNLTRVKQSESVDTRCGIAVGDVNGDGLEDVYVCQPDGLPNRLLVQRADGTVTDVSATAGVDWLDATASALLIDLDNDGDQDLAVATASGIVLMENDAKGKFQRKNVLLIDDARAQSLLAVDYDRDGRLDLYLTMAESVDYEHNDEEAPDDVFRFHDASDAGGNVLLRNEIFSDGPWRFTDVTRSAGLYQNSRRHSLAAAWEDFDNDGDLDLYVANDYGKNSLYRNDGGYFRDLAKLAKTAEYGSGKSVSWADYDRDGMMDLYVGNTFSPAGLRITTQPQFMPQVDDTTRAIYRRFAQGNTLYRNLGKGTFTEVGQAMGVQTSLWAWSSRFVDWNNDGWEDLLVANGYLSGHQEQAAQQDLEAFYWQQVVPHAKVAIGTADTQHGSPTDIALSKMLRVGHSLAGHQRNRAYLNIEGKRFADVSAVSGFDFADDGRAMATVDWDSDGDLDVWMLNHSAPQLRLLCNTSQPGQHFLAVRLQGRTCNRDAIGARVELYMNSKDETPRIKTLRAGEGYLSQSSKWMNFGLGQSKQIARVVVRWPAGEIESFDDLEVDQRYVLVQGSAQPKAWDGPSREVSLKADPHEGTKPSTPKAPFPGRWVKSEDSDSSE